RAELHAALEPAERLLPRQRAGAGLDEGIVVEDLIGSARGVELPAALLGGELGTEVRALHAVVTVAGRAWLPAADVVGAQRRAHRAARVPRGRLDPDAVEASVAQHLSVGHAVERDAA